MHPSPDIETGTTQPQDLRRHGDIGICLALEKSGRVSRVPGGTPVEAQYVDGRLCFRAEVAGAHGVYRIET